MTMEEKLYTERMMGFEEGMKMAMQESIEEGRQEERRKTIEKMRKIGMSEEQIKLILAD